MYMVGGGSGRVQRGPGRYPGETRWLTPPRPERTHRRITWAQVFDVASAVVAFAVLLWALNILALCS